MIYGSDIFLNNEASREYFEICEKSAIRNLPGEYYEVHEFIPPDFFRFLSGARVPKEKRLMCRLTPEEHWRCHQLLIDMFEKGTKAHSIALVNFWRIKSVHKSATSPEEYGAMQRKKNENWASYADELQKYT